MNLQNELHLGQLLQQPSFPISHSSSHHAPPYQVRLQKVEQFSLFQNIYFQQHPRRQTQWFQYIPLTLWFKKQQLCYSIFLNGDKRTELYYLELILTPELYYPEISLTPVISSRNHFYHRAISSWNHHSSAVWESRWSSWAVHPNEPSGFHGREELLNHASALVSACP